MSCWWPGTILEAGIFYIIFFIIILNTWRLCEWGFKLVLRCLIENKWPYVMRCAIWTHLYNLKNVKNTHRGVLILVKLQASACTFTKINTLPWVFFAFFKLYKWYQIPATITIFISIQFVWLYSLWLVSNLKDKIGQDAVKHRHESMNYKEFKKFLAKTMFFLLPHSDLLCNSQIKLQ